MENDLMFWTVMSYEKTIALANLIFMQSHTFDKTNETKLIDSQLAASMGVFVIFFQNKNNNEK